MKLSELKPNPDNPRHIKDDKFKKLCESIKKFPKMMELRPMVVDNDGVILGGNMRYNALKELGYTEIPDEWVKRADDLTEEEKKQFIIKDNMPFGEWNFDELANQFEVEDLLEWGFDEKDLKIEMEVEEDDVPDVPEEAKSKLGEIYQLGEHRLMCGDSTKIEDVEKLMDGQKADMVFTDPPYGIDIVDSKTNKVGAENLAKNKVYSAVIGDDTTDTAKEFYNTCQSLGYTNYMIWGGNYFVDFLPFSSSWVIWDKRGDMNSNNFADGEMAWTNIKTRVRIYKQIWNGMIREGEHEDRVHPTQKPIKVLGEILKDFTKELEKIFDGFGGSGSTLIACEQLNRKCYMMELDPKYIDVIIKRWEQFTGNKAKKL